MPDDRLRALERAWKESGSEQDELAYLQEQVRTRGTLDWTHYSRLAELNVEAAADYLSARVRRGDLEQEKLELAAHCSHEPARLVLGEGAPVEPEDLEEWLVEIPRWGVQAAGRATSSALNVVLRAWGTRTFFRSVVFALDRYLACPCEGHATELMELDSSEAPLTLPTATALTVTRTFRLGSAGHLRRIAALPAQRWADLTAKELRTAAQRELADWALGLRDPAQERVLLRGAS